MCAQTPSYLPVRLGRFILGYGDRVSTGNLPPLYPALPEQESNLRTRDPKSRCLANKASGIEKLRLCSSATTQVIRVLDPFQDLAVMIPVVVFRA